MKVDDIVAILTNDFAYTQMLRLIGASEHQDNCPHCIERAAAFRGWVRERAAQVALVHLLGESEGRAHDEE